MTTLERIIKTRTGANTEISETGNHMTVLVLDGHKFSDVKLFVTKLGNRFESMRFFDDGAVEMEFVNKFS